MLDDPETKFAGQPAQSHPLSPIPSGSLGLDIALGTGGIPAGAIVEIDAPEASGKTTLVCHMIGEAQRLGLACALVDADRAFEPGYAAKCGVQVERLYYCQPENAEQAFDIIERLAGSGALAVVALDSLNALVSIQELSSPLLAAAEPASSTLEADPELLARHLRKLATILRRTGARVIYTSQNERRMSRIYHQLAAHPTRLALKLNASIRLRLNPLNNPEVEGDFKDRRIQARIIKNKFSPCLQPINFDIIYQQGIDKNGELFDLGVRCKLIQLKKNGIYFQSECLGMTAREAMDFTSKNVTVRAEIEKAIRQLLIPDIQSAAT